MKDRTLVLGTLALALATSFAIAQTAADKNAAPPTGNQDSSPQKTDTINNQDKTSGNDLAASKNDSTSMGDSDPAKTDHVMSQDGKDGNNLYGGAAFDKLDPKKTGTISMSDAKSNPWLSKNFTKCDTNSDSKVSRDEYVACSPSR
jgi:hypothetical protein